MLKCAAEYLAIRNENIAINNAKAKEEEKELLKKAVENSIHFCENVIAKEMEARAEQGDEKLEFCCRFSELTKAENSPLREQYFYRLYSTPNSRLDGRMVGDHYFFDKSEPYHYETIKKYLTAYCINVRIASEIDFYYNKIGPNIRAHKVWFSIPDSLPCD